MRESLWNHSLGTRNARKIATKLGRCCRSLADKITAAVTISRSRPRCPSEKHGLRPPSTTLSARIHRPGSRRSSGAALAARAARACPVCRETSRVSSINGVLFCRKPPEMMNGRPTRPRADETPDPRPEPPRPDPRRDQPFKVLLVGGSSVGKTCILRRFVDGEFPSKCKATLGLDFKIRCVLVGGRLIKMQLWDTSGQERFRSMTQAYYRGAAGVMVVYDVTEETTLRGLGSWLEDVKKYAPEDTDIIILANKCDIVEQRVVSKEAGEEFARNHGLKFFETSANDGTNIMEAFEEMAFLLASKVTETGKRVNSIAITSPADTNDNTIKYGGLDPSPTKCAC